MKLRILNVLIPFSWLCQMAVASEAVSVHNHVLYPIYAAAYRVKRTICGTSTGPAFRQGPVAKVGANSTEAIVRPAFHLFRNRELFLSDKQTDLKEDISPDEYVQMVKFPIGVLDGSSCHVAERDNALAGFSSVDWHIFEPLHHEMHKEAESLLQVLQERYNAIPYAHTEAQIRLDSSLSQQELSAIANRRICVSRAIASITNIPVSQDVVPCVGVATSGGGMRAVIASWGLREALEREGLFDAVTYMAATSGSTWFLSDWLTFNHAEGNYDEHFLQSLTNMHVFSPEILARQLLRKFIFHQDTGIVDLYGVYLANTFFTQDPESVCLSSVASKVQDGSSPFPLCTAVETSAADHLLVCTPYEIMSESLNFSAPIWAFGRRFVNGISTDNAPEYPLGYFMGMWGSALSGSLFDMYNAVKDQVNPAVRKMLQSILQNTNLAEVRPAGIYIHNPLYGMKESAHCNIKHFVVMDGGYICNIPTGALLHPQRGVDIMLILDVSDGVHQGHEQLKKAELLARQQGKLFPPLDYEKIGNNSLTIFTDPQNAACPAVVYIFPTKSTAFDPEFDPESVFDTKYATAKFVYKAEDVEKLAGLVRTIIAEHRQELCDLIKQKTIQKQDAMKSSLS